MKVVALCFLAAATFWLFNALNKDNYTTVVDYPIEILFDQEEFMAVEKLPSRIKIEINGNGWDLLRKYFKFNDNPFLLEINNPSSAGYLLTSDIRRSLAENIYPTNLVSILEDTIKFRVDRMVTRKVKIMPDTTLNLLAKNFKLASPIKIDPPTIDIKGPASILQKLDGVLLIDLGTDEINKNFEKTLPIVIPDSLSNFLITQDSAVQINFEVAELLEGNRRLNVRLANFPNNVGLIQEVNTVMMYYLVDERSLEDLKEVSFEAVLNYRNRNRQDSTLMVQVSPAPSFLENIRLEPEIFRLKYE